jgi:hypothetical protein
MTKRMTGVAVIATAFMASSVPAYAAGGSDMPVSAAPKPDADTKDPGKTATDAVTNPSTVPPATGTTGSQVSPDANTNGSKPSQGSSPGR